MIAKEFTIPRFVKIEESATEGHARLLVEPFERGYGTTVGNSLRRVLLASLQGTAVTAIRLENTKHEFSAIPGILEDATDMVLNLKRCKISLKESDSLIFTFSHKGQGEITAADLFAGQNIEVYNPDHVILHATSKTAEIEMEVKVARGRGYLTAEHFELEHAPLGTIYFDANFSPVEKVNFQVEDARVGQTTDYDRLVLDIWTNGSITPEEALGEAATLLTDHLKIFINQEQEVDLQTSDSSINDPEFMRQMARPVEDLELSVRAANCLKAAEIKTIGELVVREETEMLQFHNFGKKSLDEVKALLETMEMSLGMDIGTGPPPPLPQIPAVVEPVEGAEVEIVAEIQEEETE
jgi:DNA-directed RNA polymerase subunit alpha